MDLLPARAIRPHRRIAVWQHPFPQVSDYMNVAFFSKDLPSDQPNGVSVQVHRLATALIDQGHQVTCFSFSPAPDNARYQVIQFPGSGTGKTLRKFTPALKFSRFDKSNFDILHYHGDDYLSSGSPKRIRTFYGSARDEAFHAKTSGRFFYQAFFHMLEHLSCLRKGTLVGISTTTKRALPRIQHIIPCGVPLDRFSPVPKLKTVHPSILFIGDFKSRKQGDLLLRTFRKTILPAHPQTILTVVGPESVKSPNVRCLGRISETDLIAEYRKAWVYCLPSSYEGFGVPAIEAMACGCAVVAIKNAGTTEIIDHDKTGLLCSPETFASSLKKTIEEAGLRKRLIKNGEMRAKDFDIKECAKKYEEVYGVGMEIGRKINR
jgi:phosphatidyl-myo-inositol alpha-mannosyltransferase